MSKWKSRRWKSRILTGSSVKFEHLRKITLDSDVCRILYLGFPSSTGNTEGSGNAELSDLGTVHI